MTFMTTLNSVLDSIFNRLCFHPISRVRPICDITSRSCRDLPIIPSSTLTRP